VQLAQSSYPVAPKLVGAALLLDMLLAAAADTFNNTEPFEAADPGLCRDFDKRCADWAKSGECTKNSKFMVSLLPSQVNCCLRDVKSAST
jgi:hypothetical protein